MSTPTPLISCLCVTRNNPLGLRRVINCFLDQTYTHKELLIVYEDDDPSTRLLIKANTHKQIRGYEVSSPRKLSLGELRNLSVQECEGEYFCQWDDDDWYHNQRLELQLASLHLFHKSVSALAYWMMYDALEQKAYLSPVGPWPGSILCKKELIREGISYMDLSKKEDSEFLGDLIKLNVVLPMIMPSLYIYCFHGKNTWGTSHFRKLFSMSQQLPNEVGSLFRRIFAGELTNDEASLLMFSSATLKDANYFLS